MWEIFGIGRTEAQNLTSLLLLLMVLLLSCSCVMPLACELEEDEV
jgi:hypothetical protein